MTERERGNVHEDTVPRVAATADGSTLPFRFAGN